MRGVFVTGTGTEVGKTVVSRALILGLQHRGTRVAGIKPIETGWNERKGDAVLLADACQKPELVQERGLYRAAAPLAPYAIELSGAHPPLVLEQVLEATRKLAAFADFAVIEGAGGFYVPLGRDETMADLASGLGLPLVLVSLNQLGVLSSVLCARECIERRGLFLRALVLVEPQARDSSFEHNARILKERLRTSVIHFPRCEGDAALIHAALDSGLVDACLSKA